MEFSWVDGWFKVLHEQGEFMEIPFARVDDATQEPDWVFLPHWEYDGVGALGHLLRESGYSIPELPRMRKARKPSPLALARALIHLSRNELRARKTPWVRYEPDTIGPFRGAAWTRFSEEETKRAVAAARENPGSLNPFLLWHLSQAVQPLFRPTPADDPCYWMVPVNMRGGVARSRDTANHSSYLGIPISRTTTPAQIQTTIMSGLRRHLHWAGWWSMKMGKWIGKKGMRRSMDDYRKKAHSWAGIFSNAGRWPPAGAHPGAPPSAHDKSGKDGVAAWIGVVTVTRGHPIGAGCVIWDGRLHLTLQMHPCLGVSLAGTREFMAEWKSSILSASEDAKKKQQL